MLTVKDSLIDAPLSKASEEMAEASPNCKFGNFVFTSGWFVKKKLFGGFEGFKAMNVCWIYPLRIKQSVNFVPTTNIWQIICKITPKKEIRLSNSETTPVKEKLIPSDSDYTLRMLRLLMPWAIFGFSQYLNECWEKHNDLFLEIQKKRFDLIRSGLEKGDIVIQPNGSLIATVQSFSLPSIDMRFEKNSQGKMERVYFARTQ
jgi:hypothetical protein